MWTGVREAQSSGGGALAYLADSDVHRAKIYGRCGATTGIEPFIALVTRLLVTARCSRRR